MPEASVAPQEESVKDMLTSQEVASMLGISMITVKRWRKAGKLPFIEFPKKTYRHYKSDVEKILREGLS